MGTWNSFPVPGAGGYFDVMTDPTNPDKVFIVGDAAKIFSSSNAALSWNTPGGTYNTNPATTFHEVWCVNPSTIVAVGTEGKCVISNDGGLTFNTTPAFPTPPAIEDTGEARAVHFITPLIGIVGYDNLVFTTTNAGVSWVWQNGSNFLGLGQGDNINAVHMSANQQVIVVSMPSGIYRSTNGGTTFVQTFAWPQRQGTHMTWINDNELWAVGNFSSRIVSIDAGATWIIQSNLSPSGFISEAEHFYSNNNGFFNLTVSLYATADSGLTGALSDNNPGQSSIKAVWTQLDTEVCYLLEDCKGLVPDIIVTGVDWATYVGLVIQVSIFGNTCWTVSIAPDCANAIDLSGIDPVIDVFVDCATCDPTICYTLTECTGVVPPFQVSSDLALLIGLTINQLITSQQSYLPTLCFQVTLFGPCQSTITVTSYNPITFPDCECCQPLPPPPPPFIPEKIIPGPVRIFYQITEGPCDIKANKQFAEGFWNQVKFLKFGISSCCEGINFEQLWLKKALSDLSTMKDPNFCLQPSCGNSGCNTCGCTNTCNTCRSCQSCSPCGCYLTPCNLVLPNQPQNPCNVVCTPPTFPGEFCYAQVCFPAFPVCPQGPVVGNTFTFLIGGIPITSAIVLLCDMTMVQIQAAINLAILNALTTQVVVTSFDDNGICFTFTHTFTLPQPTQDGCVDRDDGDNIETICTPMICSLVPPPCTP